jgi:hypothetical protein
MGWVRGVAGVVACGALLVACSTSDDNADTPLSDTQTPATAVPTAPEGSASNESGTPTPAIKDRARGLMSLPAAAEALYERTSTGECSEPPISSQAGYAFAVGKRAVFCAAAVTKMNGEQPWGGRFSVLTVDLPSGTSQSEALKVVRQLLPLDATRDSQALGRNPDHAEIAGSCLRVHFASPALAQIVAVSNPTWYRPAGATAVLYTGKRLEGAAGPYSADSVDFLSIDVEGADSEGGC